MSLNDWILLSSYSGISLIIVSLNSFFSGFLFLKFDFFVLFELELAFENNLTLSATLPLEVVLLILLFGVRKVSFLLLIVSSCLTSIILLIFIDTLNSQIIQKNNIIDINHELKLRQYRIREGTYILKYEGLGIYLTLHEDSN